MCCKYAIGWSYNAHFCALQPPSERKISETKVFEIFKLVLKFGEILVQIFTRGKISNKLFQNFKTTRWFLKEKND